MLKKIFFIFPLLYSGFLFSQRIRTFEIGVVVDNDSFTSTVNDKYYTNGAELFYQHLSNQSHDTLKKIIRFKAGQYIYNPKWVKSDFIVDHNRPYAGYLFAELGIRRFYKSQSVWITNFQVGVVGPLSNAENVQKTMHTAFGFGKIYGWQHQIENTLGLQYNSIFSKKLPLPITTANIDFHGQLKIDLGTIFTGFSLGSLMRISLTKPLISLQHSNFYDASLQNEVLTSNEWYLFILPVINYQMYDATILGSAYESNSSNSFRINPFRFNGEIGFKFRHRHWNLSYSALYKSNEISNSTTTGFYYGSIAASYLF